MRERLSESIKWLRFPLIFLIILLHCYSVVRIPGNHGTFFMTVYPFSLWLGETGVPAFFFISGYLFFLSKKTYKQKLQTRFHTLLIPYLLWNIVLLLLYLAAFAFGYPQDINGRSLTEYRLIDYIRLFWDRGSYDNGNFVPLLCPLWYIRNLLIMSILSPIVYYIIRYAKELFLMILTVWWMMTYHNAFIPQTILFFSLGSYFSILDINPLQLFTNRKGMFLTLFLLFGIGDIVTHTILYTPVNLQIHRFALIFNIPALFLLADYCEQHDYSNKMLPNAAFIVFCVHYPIVVALRKVCAVKLSDAPDIIHTMLYFVCVIFSTLISIGFSFLMDKYLPNIKRILSGSR